MDETAVESHTTIEGREVRDVIRKPYNISNKKGNCPKSRPRNYLWISCEGVLYGHSERSGVLYGNHIYTVGSHERTRKVKRKAMLLILALCCCSCEAAPPSDLPTLIEQSQRSVVRLVVVGIDATKKPVTRVVGSGFVVAPGKIATSAHILTKLPKGILLFLVPASQEQFDVKQNVAEVNTINTQHDLALLECPALIQLPSLTLGETKDVRLGEQALILGFPLSDPTLTATRGMVAAKSKKRLIENDPTVTEMLKLDASINVGNSGGPIIHIPSGKVIGIVSAKEGSLSKRLQAFRKKKSKAAMSIGGDDPIKLIKETLNDMERNLQLGLGYGVNVEYLKTMLNRSGRTTGK